MCARSSPGISRRRPAARSGWTGRAKLGGTRDRKCTSFADLAARFPHFQDEWLRDLQPDVWVPAKFKGRPYNIFETGGTTGMPKQRIGWDDYKTDYEEFSAKLADEHFPRGAAWLMVGPTGPRRLRLAIEHLANFRGSPCYFVDLDPRWVKKVIAEKKLDQARAYMDHVVDQAVILLKHRSIAGLFTTPEAARSAGREARPLRGRHPRRVLRRHDDGPAIRALHRRGSAGRPHRLLPDLRQYADGPGGQRAVAARGQFLGHLLRAAAARRAPRA